MTTDELVARFRDALPAGIDHAQLRYVDERTDHVSVRKGVVEPPVHDHDRGVMITVREGGGEGYAATPDLSASGLHAAIQRARDWARRTAGLKVYDPREAPLSTASGQYATPVARAWSETPWSERLGMVRAAADSLHTDDRIVLWSASVMAVDTDIVLADSEGGVVHQRLRHLAPELTAYAHDHGTTQRRTLGGLRGASQQGGLEVLDRMGFVSEGPRVAEEALELAAASPCPEGVRDIVLAPDQMMLQIHESIGHPLELDRILGDERNYAGTSFVTMDMFGSYRYGSELLNVTFDPSIDTQFASYGFDDHGIAAERTWIIRNGLLLRPLGGVISQARAGMQGVANSRASSWHRPPIDRMANLNIEPGSDDLQALIGKVEQGVWMETNRSWSIDDSRNKFQFGVERARLIVDGELGPVVRDAGYRGVSASFWRSLAGVGDRSTFQVLGTPYCGKGEPNQVVRVGHASPACLFRAVEVFGGQA